MKPFLICEDDRDLADFLNTYLGSKGYNYRLVDQGEMVLPVLKKQDMGFLLLDLNLPDIDGKEVIRQVREDPQITHIPIVLFTATTRAEDIMKEFKVDGLLKKPFEMKELREVIYKYTS